MANRGPKKKFGIRQRTTIEWSSNLLNAIDSLREDESLSVWTEKILRRTPEIAAQLILMGDEGFPQPSLRDIAQEAILQAKEEGCDEDDARWLAVGAINREARHQGIIGDELSPEMNAASQQIVKQIQK